MPIDNLMPVCQFHIVVSHWFKIRNRLLDIDKAFANDDDKDSEHFPKDCKRLPNIEYNSRKGGGISVTIFCECKCEADCTALILLSDF